MKLTIFHAKKTKAKIPKSPTNDKKFTFETMNVDSILDVYTSLTSHFTLNIPLTKANIFTERNKKSLQEYFVKKLEYIVVDIDDVNTVSDREFCIKFFRDNNYACVLGESRTDYRIKGVLKVNCNLDEAKLIAKEIHKELKEYGVFDLSITNRASFQAPTFKNNILFQNLNGIEYPIPSVDISNKPKTISFQPPKDIQTLCQQHFMKLGYVFHELKGSCYVVSHSSEKKSPKGFSWCSYAPFKMFHFNPSRNVDIWNEIKELPKYKKLIKNKSTEEIKKIIPKCVANTNEKYLSANNHLDKIDEFLNNKKLLKIQSPMGTAKTKIIEEVLRKAKEKNYRVLFITNRRSLAHDISDKYFNIKHYEGTKIEENKYYEIGDNLVCQIDSLYKFSMKYFDIIILDEFSTLINKILNINEDRKPHSNKIITQFFSFNKKKILIADAIIFDTHIDLFASKDETVEIINGYRDNISLEFFKQKDNFVDNLLDTAENKPITFSSGSISIIKSVKSLLEKRNISYRIISSETTEEEKNLIYKSFKNKKPLAQVIMYSPSLTVGVSNENKIDTHYHYDSGNSMSVLDSLQMIKRTRSVTNIKLFLDQRQKYNSLDLNTIETSLSEFSELDSDGDIISLTPIGKKMAQLIRIDNTLENLHKTSFKELMKFQFNLSPSNITKNDKKIVPFLRKTSIAVKKQEQNKNLDLFEEYKKMSPMAISDIEMKIYGTSKREQNIKLFEMYRNDTINKYINEEELDEIIKEEIKHEGVIESLKNIFSDFESPSKSLKKVYSNKEYSKFKEDYKKYSYRKKRNRWYLNSVISKIIFKDKKKL